MVLLLVLLLPDLLIAQAVLNELLIPELLLLTRSRTKAGASLPARLLEMGRGVTGRYVREGRWLDRRTVPASENRLESSFIMWLNWLIGQVNPCGVFPGTAFPLCQEGVSFPKEYRERPAGPV